MCGINGIFAFHDAANPIDRAELLRTRDHMLARGPDGCGLWVSDDARIGLGHRRLAIIDLSEAGAQPMQTADGRFIVTFNGEIYNFPSLRRELEAKGYVFRSQSDTEVLLHLYADCGAEMVHALRGMFAFAIWDNLTRELFLARDPYGIKPLYYSDDCSTFRFASQVKALIAGGEVSRNPDPAGHVGFYLLGSVPEPLTTFEAIRALPAGCTLLVDGAGKREPHQYHSISQVYVSSEAGRAVYGPERQVCAREALLDSVRHHLVSDVPVGAFLSAGIDSSALVGLMRDAGQNVIETVTLSFEEYRGTSNDESPLAEDVARTYGTRHTTRVVTSTEFHSDLPHILESMDQPSIDGINSWFVAKAARERGLKVAISGVGGDELFGGYPSFRDVPRWVAWLRAPSSIPLLGKAFRGAVVAMGPQRIGLSPKAAGLIEFGGDYAGAWYLRRGVFMPWELGSLLGPEMIREGLARLSPRSMVREALDPMPRSSFARVATMETALYMRNQLLRDSDWASMAHSLEVRTPLVDATLLRRIAALGPPARTDAVKHQLANAPLRPLPPAVLTRKKTGFSVPLAPWMTEGSDGGRRPARDPRGWAKFVGDKQLATWPPVSP